MIAVRDQLDQFGDATVAVVTFADPARLAAYRNLLRLPFDVLADPDRNLYRGARRRARLDPTGLVSWNAAHVRSTHP